MKVQSYRKLHFFFPMFVQMTVTTVEFSIFTFLVSTTCIPQRRLTGSLDFEDGKMKFIEVKILTIWISGGNARISLYHKHSF